MSDINKKSSSRLKIKQMQSILFSKLLIRDIRKVRKRQHQYPEFGHTQGEIFKKPAKKYVSIQAGGGLRKPSILTVPEFHPVFLFSRAPPLLLHRFSLLKPA
jgi:hypothetical protein